MMTLQPMQPMRRCAALALVAPALLIFASTPPHLTYSPTHPPTAERIRAGERVPNWEGKQSQGRGLEVQVQHGRTWWREGSTGKVQVQRRTWRLKDEEWGGRICTTRPGEKEAKECSSTEGSGTYCVQWDPTCVCHKPSGWSWQEFTL